MFERKNNQLYIENLCVEEIRKEVQTPFYLYSQDAIKKNFYDFSKNAEKHLKKSLICFSIKSNPNLALVTLLAKLGAGADVVSGNELRLALKAGVEPEKIVFSGVGKTKTELELAVLYNIKQVNLESKEEAFLLDEIAQKYNKKINVALRVNPDVDAKTHAKITTGKKENKFGIAWQEAEKLYHILCQKNGLNVVGIDMHVGSQLLEKQPFEEMFNKMIEIIQTLEKSGVKLQTIDVGGGVGVAYHEQDTPLSIEEYMRLVALKLERFDCEIIFEPGRYIIGQAGVLISEVVRIKETQNRNFVILDAGMNDLIRPAMYEAYHEIEAMKDSEEKAIFDIVGPICESSDVFAKERLLPSEIQEGDAVAIKTAGAYGASMASNYNFRPICAEVLVHNESFKIIKKRQSFEEMLAPYCLPEWL